MGNNENTYKKVRKYQQAESKQKDWETLSKSFSKMTEGISGIT